MSAKFGLALAASAARTTSGTGATLDLEVIGSTARLWLDVSAVTGATPSLTVTIEHSHNGTTWETLGTPFEPRSTAGAEYKAFPGARQYIRARWVITGTTPEVTFSVLGEQVLVYATPADVKLLGLPAAAMAGDNPVTDTEIDRAVEAAGDTIDGYLATADITTPLEEWPNDVRRAAAIIAGYDIISVRVGYNPEADRDDPWRKRYEDVIRWLERIADGSNLLPGIPVPDPGTTVGRVMVVSSEEPRGW